jgi:hypothetical protein
MRMIPLDFHALRQDCPFIFGGGAFISLWVGTGWTSIVRSLCEALEVIARQRSAEGLPPLHILQVKEQDGVLACLLTNAPEAALLLVQQAQAQSETVCEACGRPGRLVTIDAWTKVYCPRHRRAAQA